MNEKPKLKAYNFSNKKKIFENISRCEVEMKITRKENNI
jgi:hypothetical protein